MRKSGLLSLAALALPLWLSGCGDDSPAPALSSQDKQTLASLAQSLKTFSTMSSGYASMAASQSKSSISGVAGRALATSCGLVSDTANGMIINIAISDANGKAFANCADERTAYLNGGLTLDMSMKLSEQGMNMTSTYKVKMAPNATGGYVMDMTASMSMTMVTGNGQTMAISINPITMKATAATADAVPTMLGSMTMSIQNFTFVGVKFDANGLVAQTVDILKDGSKVATMTIDSKGNSTIVDTDGNTIQ